MNSLLELQSVLQKQVSAGGNITVSAATLKEANITAAPDFDTTIQSYLMLKTALSVSVTGAVPPPTGNLLTVSGTASFLQLNTIDLQVTFTLETDNTMNAMLVATLPADWNFNTSWPEMRDFPFTDIAVTGSSFLLTTALQDSYTWQSKTITLAKGLNYVSYLKMGGPFTILQQLISSLLPDDKVIFSGTIDPTAITDTHRNPAVSLKGSIDKPISADTSFDLSVPAVQIVSNKDETGYMVYRLLFSSTLSINKKPFSIFQAALFEDSDDLELSLLPADKAITPEQIIELIGKTDFTASIPPVLKDIFKAVGLKALAVSLNTKTLEIFYIDVIIGASGPWTMGQFQLTQMDLDCLVMTPFTGKSVSITFTATAFIFKDIFNGEFHFEISYDVTDKVMVIAANFEGVVKLKKLIEGLSDHTITLPDNFVDIELDDFGMTFTNNAGVYDYNLYGTAKGTFNVKLLDSPVVATFEVNIDSAQKSYVLTGGLTIGNSFFQAIANLSGSKQILTGSWQALNDEYLGLNNLLPALGFPNPDIPADLDLALKSAAISYNITDQTFVITAASANYGTAVFVAYKNPVTAAWQFYFGLKIDKPINLSNLPLINKVLSPDETFAIKELQVILSSVPLDPGKPADKKEIDLINSLIKAGYPAIPQQGLTGSIALAAQFDFGGFIIPLSIGTPKKQTSGLPALQKGAATVIGSPSGNNAAPVPNPTQAADGATWFNIQKNFGPVNFQKVGVKYEDGILWFLINASLTAAGLEISVMGLAVGSPLSTFKPSFNIQGLGINFSNDVVTISGAFVKLPAKDPITLEFAGTATIQLKTFGISAVGAYAQFSGQTSMFVFANVSGPFGGPPFFFVTGFCGGFGYNSKLRIPGQNEVYQFPFVASLSDPNVLGPAAGPTDVLQKIMGGDKPWVSPSAGDIWLATGIRFTTFQLVNSTALLIAEFGNNFLMALVGISRARFPMEGEMIYAYIELQLEALFDPGEGVVSFTAVLSPNSFLFDRNCHLTGGFAMVYWFGPSSHAGDFVLTLGGYSPYYKPPAHYPQEPRLGFNWAIDASMSISGGAYFAVTPAALMAGGSLDAMYHSGNLKAWFNAHADIIIWYNPFHFIADIGITIGASYKLDLELSTITLSVELGADLTLWGPPTGGTVTVHWFVISFTIGFGSDQTSVGDKQGWDDFSKVLPAAADVVKIVPLTGLMNGPVSPDQANRSRSVRTMAAATKKDDQPWVVRSDNFQFTTNSSVPLTELYIGKDTTPVSKGSVLNIKPMQATGLTSKKTLSIISKETGKNVLDKTWGIEAMTGNVPNALWGTGSSKVLPKDGDLVKDQLSGFRITVPPPALGSGTGDISIQNDLQFDPLPPGKNPLQLGLDPQGPVPVASDTTIADIEKIMSLKEQRDKIYNTFTLLHLEGLENGDLTALGQHAGAIFVNEPLLTGQ